MVLLGVTCAPRNQQSSPIPLRFGDGAGFDPACGTSSSHSHTYLLGSHDSARWINDADLPAHRPGIAGEVGPELSISNCALVRAKSFEQSGYPPTLSAASRLCDFPRDFDLDPFLSARQRWNDQPQHSLPRAHALPRGRNHLLPPGARRKPNTLFRPIFISGGLTLRDDVAGNDDWLLSLFRK